MTYGHVARARETDGELRTLFGEVEEYFELGVRLDPGACIVDAGANIGAFAVAAGRRCRAQLRLFCFEPVPALFSALEQNLRSNEWLAGGTHQAFPLALSTAEEAGSPCEFFYFHRFPRDSTMDIKRKRTEFAAFFAAQGARIAAKLSWLGPGARWLERVVGRLTLGPLGEWASDRVTGLERIEVPRDCLSRALAPFDLERIDLLKVDVEGAEAKVLSGIEASLWPKIQQVVLETDGSDGSVEPLVSLVRARGLTRLKLTRPLSTRLRGLPNLMIYAARPAGP